MSITENNAELKEVKNDKTANTDIKMNKPSTFVDSAHGHMTSKSFLQASIPVQSHSTRVSSKSTVKDDKTLPEANDCYASNLNIHPIRDSNVLPTLERNKKDKLQLPKSCDPVWKEIENELKTALPKVFTKSIITNNKSHVLIEKFDNWIYDFFKDKFGTIPPAEKKSPFVARPHKGLIRLRENKKRVRKAVRILEREGLKGTPEWESLQKEWFTLVRKHNRLRKALLKANKKRKGINSEKAFKQNSWKYTRDLFNPPSAIGSPTFSKEKAEAYFTPLYRDEQRDYHYQPLEGLEKPNPPVNIFDLGAPTLGELFRSARKKPNGAAAGINGLPYIIYKKCPTVLRYLHKIILKIWLDKDIPPDWAITYISLIAKSSNLDQPSEFRPIAVGNTAGKIFFSIIADRLQRYMVDNQYIRVRKQKGFLEGMAGCLEHSFVLWEALRNAKTYKRSIVATWIDLANAYGSVRHNLIQFALNWYGVPKDIQDLIFSYYEKLSAKIIAENWSTGFFLFDIGCFQGCVLSAILFDCVFNLLLDFLAPLESLGYQFKATKLVTMDQAYADDLTIITDTSKSNQKVLDQTDTWLDWTKTMKAKPAKCVSAAFRQFTNGSNNGFIPLTGTVYAPYDPILSISGRPIRFILDPTNQDDFKSKHFKHLGRWLSINLDEKDIKLFIKKEFTRKMTLIDKDSVNGCMKLWIYEHGILSSLSWPFLVQDLPLSFAKDLEVIAHRFLKNWIGLFRNADLGVLFRPRDRFGIGMTPISSYFKKMGVIKCLLLKQSKDLNVREIYKIREEREANFNIEWRASKFATEVESIVKHNMRFSGQQHRIGLGNGTYNVNPSKPAFRKMCSTAISNMETEKLWSHSHTLAMQGLWSQWFELTLPLDFTWKNLIYGPGKKIISFLLNACINTLPTPYLFKLMGYSPSGKCPICPSKNCNLSHVLAGCKTALCSKRYTWRHDSVILTLSLRLEDRIAIHNESRTTSLPSYTQPISCFFVPAGASISQKSKRQLQQHLLSGAHDWKILFDTMYNKMVFPPEICSTDLRPDILIWSTQLKQVFMIELTVPADENIEAAEIRKTARYQELAQLMKTVNNWNSKIITIEVGARAFVARSMNSCLRSLGFTPRAASSLCKDVSQVVARCSHNIYQNRENKKWKMPPLLVPYNSSIGSDNTDVDL